MKLYSFVLTGILTLCIVLITIVPTSASPDYNGSVIGKIAGITTDSLSLQLLAEEDRRMVLYFLIGPSTRIDGQLKIGITAGVEYLSLGSCNFATHVMVDARESPFSGN